MSQTHVQCLCGAKINSDNDQYIQAFDAIHGTVEHQNRLLEIKAKVLEIRAFKLKIDAKDNG